MTTEYFSLSSFMDILHKYKSTGSYNSAETFYKSIVLSSADINDEQILDDCLESDFFSNLQNLTFSGQLTQNKMGLIVSKLIILFYKGGLTKIANRLALDFSNYSQRIIQELKSVKTLTLINLDIIESNPWKILTACILHSFYHNEMPGSFQPKSKKKAIELLRINSIPLNKLKHDFPKYHFNGDTWNYLDKFNAESNPTYIKNFRDWDINYNLETLINLYLNNDDNQGKEKFSPHITSQHNSSPPQTKEEKQTHDEFQLPYSEGPLREFYDLLHYVTEVIHQLSYDIKKRLFKIAMLPELSSKQAELLDTISDYEEMFKSNDKQNQR